MSAVRVKHHILYNRTDGLTHSVLLTRRSVLKKHVLIFLLYKFLLKIYIFLMTQKNNYNIKFAVVVRRCVQRFITVNF